MDSFISQFLTILGKNLEKNDTSFEILKIELLESGEKLGVALSWSWPRPPKQKSVSFARICLRGEYIAKKSYLFRDGSLTVPDLKIPTLIFLLCTTFYILLSQHTICLILS